MQAESAGKATPLPAEPCQGQVQLRVCVVSRICNHRTSHKKKKKGGVYAELCVCVCVRLYKE